MNNEYPVSTDKPALVTGASGFMGSHVTRLLVEQGRKVRVLVRKTSNTRAFADLDIELFYGDVLQPDTLRTAIQGCSTIFYNVLDPRFWLSDPKPLFRNNVEGLVNTMDIALGCGIERFIFTSTMGTLGLNPHGPVTEEIPFNWKNKASPYILARYEAEQQFLNYCREKNLPGVALCIANTYGPQDYQPTPHNGNLGKVAQGKEKRFMNVSQPTVDIRDAAQAALLAERFGRAGERYILANEYVTNRELFTLATEITGEQLPKAIPQWIAYLIAGVAEFFFKLLGKKDYLLSTDAVFLSNCFKELDSSKARTELGWQPRPLKETVADAVAWFAEHPPKNKQQHN